MKSVVTNGKKSLAQPAVLSVSLKNSPGQTMKSYLTRSFQKHVGVVSDEDA